jgi:hypothetical protein
MKAHNQKHQMNDGMVQVEESHFGIKAERPDVRMRSSYSGKSENENAQKAENQMRGSGFKYHYSGRKLL